MRLRKTALVAAGLVAVLAAAAGCGSGSGAGGGTKNSDGSVTIDWQMWAGSSDEQKQLDHLTKLVHQKYPKINLKLRTAPFKDYFTKLQTEMSAGKQACLVSMQSLRLPGFAANLEPLDQLAKDADLSGFDPAALKALKADGKQYALPMDLGALMMYYNADAFKKAGLKAPAKGWTIDEFVADAKALKAKSGKPGFGMSFSDLNLMSLLYAYNGAQPVSGDKLTLTGKKMQDAMTWYTELATKEKVGSVPASSSEGGWGETQFANGNAMMAVDGTWNIGSTIGQAKFNASVAPLPVGSAGARTYVANSGYGISTNCAYKKQAFQALSVLTGDEAEGYLADQGRAYPARTSQQPKFGEYLAKQDPKKADLVKNALATVKDGLDGSVPFTTTQNWDQVNQLFSQYLLQAYTGATSPKNALDTVQQRAQRGA
ncbi:ABC transporter substrate-binding protein [Actinocatenispora rupis]|uniref:Sugar ABC transporter substrate-binding protein n=1 Tax=Actinocatenispora rupis TaxID=519421 RepID=A0A8J3NDR2_9ACTN|nr:sugar ABC transporter substrate-binding protein [Actinocatenispora rupis]GID13205.1 sugar ABC transporter substrate-binding protein [Actinocatenispora rupis]